MSSTLYIGFDVHKSGISVAIASGERGGEVAFIGEIPNTPDNVAKLLKRMVSKGRALEFCYEAGPCGYGLYRQIVEAGLSCMVVAPSRIPKASGDKIKTDRRDAQKLAVLHRSGDLVRVWIPDQTHEAMRDLVRARTASMVALSCAKQQLLAFLLRHGRIYEQGRKYWTYRHKEWLAGQDFDDPAQCIVFQDYLETVWAAKERHDTLIKQIEALVPQWSLGPLVEALRCFRGMELVSASTFVASVGDLIRFDTPRQLMAYLGLTPSEYSSGGRISRGGITKTGNREARRMLVEASWSYRYPARVSQDKIQLVTKQPKAVRDIAWKAQDRLCKRYRMLARKGKKSTVVVTAIARELSGFIWSMGRELAPEPNGPRG
jgi:transposase